MTDLDAVAEAMWLTHTGDFPAWSELPEDDRNLYRALAQAAIDALQIIQEWGAISAGELEPHQVFDFRGPAEQISTWRNEHGIPAHVVSRPVGPWVRIKGRQ